MTAEILSKDGQVIMTLNIGKGFTGFLPGVGTPAERLVYIHGSNERAGAAVTCPAIPELLTDGLGVGEVLQLSNGFVRGS